MISYSWVPSCMAAFLCRLFTVQKPQHDIRKLPNMSSTLSHAWSSVGGEVIKNWFIQDIAIDSWGIEKERAEDRRRRKIPLPHEPGCRAAPPASPTWLLTDVLPVPWCLFYTELLSYLTVVLLICMQTVLALVPFLLVFLPAALQKSSAHDHCCLANPAFVSSLWKLWKSRNYSLER